MIVMRAALKTRRAQVSRLERQYMEAADDEDPDAALYGMEYNTAAEALTAAEAKLKQKEAALGVSETQALNRLASSEYMRLRMNARALKFRIRNALRARKFELDKVERSYRRLINGERVFGVLRPGMGLTRTQSRNCTRILNLRSNVGSRLSINSTTNITSSVRTSPSS